MRDDVPRLAQKVTVRRLATLWPIVQYLWAAVALAFLVGIAVNLVFGTPRQDILDALARYQPVVFVAALALGTLTAATRLSHRQAQVRALANEYALLVMASDLRPKDLGFGRQEDAAARRPYHEPYIHRTFTRLEGSRVANLPDEAALAGELLAGRGFAIVGEPTDGKTRTLYEVLKDVRLRHYMICRPLTSRTPSEQGLRLLQRRRVLLLLDDINDYAGSAVDLVWLRARISGLAAQCVVAATCRDGPEMNAVRDARGSLRRFFDDIPNQLRLERATDEQLAQLADIVGSTTPLRPSRFATLGAIAMEDALRYMRGRFSALSAPQRSCLQAVQLLVAGGVLPLTQTHVKATLQTVFGEPTSGMPESLQELQRLSFLVSSYDEEQVVPEPAYFSRWSDSVVVYRQGRTPRDDFSRLADVLRTLDDRSAMFSLGATTWYFYGDREAALTILDDLPNDELAVLVVKPILLRELGRIDAAMQAFDELARVDVPQDHFLRPEVAIALMVKARVLFDSGRSEEAASAYWELTRRFGGDSDVRVQMTLVLAMLEATLLLRKAGRASEAREASAEAVRLADGVAGAADSGRPLPGSFHRIAPGVIRPDAGEDAQAFARRLRAYSMTLHAEVLFDGGEPEHSIEILSSVVDSFGTAPDSLMRATVADAVTGKIVALERCKRIDEAVALASEMMQRYGADPGPEIRLRVARVMFKRGELLEDAHRLGEAATAFRDLMEKHWDDSDAQTRKIARRAFAPTVKVCTTLGDFTALTTFNRWSRALSAEELEEMGISLSDAAESATTD